MTDTAFCRNCNARDRVIRHGRCVACQGFPHLTPEGQRMAHEHRGPNNQVIQHAHNHGDVEHTHGAQTADRWTYKSYR